MFQKLNANVQGTFKIPPGAFASLIFCSFGQCPRLTVPHPQHLALALFVLAQFFSSFCSCKFYKTAKHEWYTFKNILLTLQTHYKRKTCKHGNQLPSSYPTNKCCLCDREPEIHKHEVFLHQNCKKDKSLRFMMRWNVQLRIFMCLIISRVIVFKQSIHDIFIILAISWLFFLGGYLILTSCIDLVSCIWSLINFHFYEKNNVHIIPSTVYTTTETTKRKLKSLKK